MNNSLAQFAGQLWYCKALQKRAPAGLQGFEYEVCTVFMLCKTKQFTIGIRGWSAGGCRPPGLKTFRTNSVFQGKRKLLKNPE